jgi:hypothetical protein
LVRRLVFACLITALLINQTYFKFLFNLILPSYTFIRLFCVFVFATLLSSCHVTFVFAFCLLSLFALPPDFAGKAERGLENQRKGKRVGKEITAKCSLPLARV